MKLGLEVIRQRLEPWLSAQIGSTVTLTGLSRPRSGISNETITGRAVWADDNGLLREEGIVLRIQQSSELLRPDSDVLYQARVMQVLAGQHRLPAPGVLFVEPDPGVLGAPFFVMERVEGRIPADVPSWHARGWATKLEAEERTLLHDNALASLVSVHSVTGGDELTFLRHPGPGTALENFITYVQRWYEWWAPGQDPTRHVVDSALEYVHTTRPDDRSAVVIWGDARPGNVVFAPDLSVVALLDWEDVAFGPAGIDLAWWVVFEEFLSEAQGLRRLDGVPDRDETIDRYESLTGSSVANIEYYEVLAGLVLSLAISRRVELLITRGSRPNAVEPYRDCVIDMTARLIADRTGRNPRR